MPVVSHRQGHLDRNSDYTSIYYNIISCHNQWQRFQLTKTKSLRLPMTQ